MCKFIYTDTIRQKHNNDEDLKIKGMEKQTPDITQVTNYEHSEYIHVHVRAVRVEICFDGSSYGLTIGTFVITVLVTKEEIRTYMYI